MNSVRIVRGDGATQYILGGGDCYLNGRPVKGVLALEPHLTKAADVASITITLAVSEFVFGACADPASGEAQRAFLAAKWA
jgi:hypothetical protein